MILNKKRSEKVEVGETLATIYANDESKLDKAKKGILESYLIEEEKSKEIPLIYGIIK